VGHGPQIGCGREHVGVEWGYAPTGDAGVGGWGMGGGSLKQGAETSVYLAISKDVENISGKYFVSKRAAHPAEISYDIEVQKRLWEISLKMSGL